jgi:hypothetical protein
VKLNKQLLTFFATIVATIALIFFSYKAGYNSSQNEFGDLTMMINIDNNLVTTGIYESLPNNVKKAMQFSITGSPTIVNDIKLFAEVKYMTIGGEVINISNGKFWSYLKNESIYQRQLKKNGKNSEKENKKQIKGSNLALIESN